MYIGSVTVSAVSYGYWPGGCPSCGEANAATGTISGETLPEESTPSSASGQTTQQGAASSGELTPEEQKQVAQLRQRDRKVRAHEAAHVAAGGWYVRGGATFSYQTGPEGKRYAVGGEVSIDISTVRDNPAATVRKMQIVRRAALAPADPSGQDRAVAAAASASEARARQDLREEQSAESREDREGKKVTIRNGYNSRGTAETASRDSRGFEETPSAATGLQVDLKI